MLVQPRQLSDVVDGPRGMLKGIEKCLEAECLVSAVTLIFSSVDALASLTRPRGQVSTNGTVFRTWVDQFFQPQTSLGCSADDLWGARCGVLHLYSAESDMAAQHRARRIYYQWSAGPSVNASRPLPAGHSVILIEHLHHAFQDATARFATALEADSNLRKIVVSHLSSMLCYEPYPPLVVVVDA